ncbi:MULTISPECIES: type VII secretion target [unclassified Nocardia]|uniref:type VII secretion target n=2 Tax=Nocardia TaxID=1817 RepID=UPI002E21FB7B|nr:ESX-1 secretion-associated protein [Nocardia sp. NBC_01009]
MSDFSMDTEGVAAFAATNAGIAGEIAGAGNLDAVGNVVAMTPVFGLIGADYLVAFAAAQVLQARDINDLSGKYAKLSEATFSTVATINSTDLGNAGSMASLGNQIGGAV